MICAFYHSGNLSECSSGERPTNWVLKDQCREDNKHVCGIGKKWYESLRPNENCHNCRRPMRVCYAVSRVT